MWAAFTVAFFGFLRASEFTASTSESATLQWSDIQLSLTHLSISIRQSKTDPFRKGHTIHVAATGTSTCPVKAMHQYSAMLSTRGPAQPVFTAGQFSPLTRTHVTNTIRQLLQQAGLQAQFYSSHSFRIRAATTAAAEGLPAWLIKSLGRWSSDAYLTYVRCPQEVIQSYPSILARANVNHLQPWIPDEH